MSSAQTDWRALREELAHEVQQYAMDRDDEFPECLDRARTVLSQPEPEGVGPTDWRVDVLSKAGLAMSDVKAYAARTWPHATGEINDSEWQESLVELLIGALDELGLSRPAPAPAGEVAEFADALRDRAAQLRAAGFSVTAGEIARAADLLERQSAPAPSDVYFEFVVSDADCCTQAGGIAPTYAQALSEGQHYLSQYQQDGPHTLEVRRVEVLHPDALPVLPEDAQVIEPTEHTIPVPAPVPVAVSEMPWEREGWCHPQERWAWFYNRRVGWRDAIPPESLKPPTLFPYTHSLPFNALPLPGGGPQP